MVTAIRMEVPPVDAEKACHTPENGFIVDKVEAWLVEPGGAREKIDFRFFAQDSEPNLRSAIFSNVKLDPKPGEIVFNTGGDGSCPQFVRGASQTLSHPLDRWRSCRAGEDAARQPH